MEVTQTESINKIEEFLNTPLVKDSTGSTLINLGYIVFIAIGVLGLYFWIPEKNRSRIFK